MPCDTISTVSIELKNANLDILKKVIEKLGYTARQNSVGISWGYGRYSYNQNTGQLTVEYESEVVQIKRSYAAEMVKAKASRFGWRVRQVGEYKFQIQKG